MSTSINSEWYHKKVFLTWMVLSVIAALVFGFFDGDFLLAIAVAISLSILVTSTFYLAEKKQETGHFDSASNLIKNVLEIGAIILVTISAYKSNWFEDFFHHKDVAISGILLEQANASRLPVNEPVHLQCDFHSPDTIVTYYFVAENGILKEKIRIHEDYDKVSFTIHSSQYSFGTMKQGSRINLNHSEQLPFHHTVSYHALLFRKDSVKIANNTSQTISAPEAVLQETDNSMVKAGQ